MTDAEFADDVALVTESIRVAKHILDRLEIAVQNVWLPMNDEKTKFMTVNNIPLVECSLASSSGDQLEHVADFKYVGCWIAISEKYFRVRKVKALAACHSPQTHGDVEVVRSDSLWQRLNPCFLTAQRHRLD